MEPIVYSVRDVARMLGISETALRSRLSRGKGAPPFRRISDRKVCCLQSELFAWLDSLQGYRARLMAVPDPELEIDLGDGGDG